MYDNRSMPTSAIIPELPYPDVREAVDWLCQTFGFTERLRIGTHRAQLAFGAGSMVVTACSISTRWRRRCTTCPLRPAPAKRW